MTPPDTDELVLIRHAPADHGGRLCGRTDVAARLPDAAALAPLRAWLAGCTDVVASPASRCVETARALFPGHGPRLDATLWEQDFGEEDGLPFAALPDLGPLPREALAQRCPPGGESFLDMVARVGPALETLAAQARTGGPVVVVAHAGTVRAALGLALGAPSAGLGFEVAPLSVTRLRCFGGGFSVIGCNWPGPGRAAQA